MADDRVSKKIRILRGENVPERQAVAMALSMNRAHRLTPSGDYIRAGKRQSKSRTTGRR